MTKEVLITFRSMQKMPGEEEQRSELSVPGVYYFKNGRHYCLYEEYQDDSAPEHVTKNRIRFDTKSLEIRKNGLAESHMVFHTERATQSDYHTPFGTMRLGIAETALQLSETEEKIELLVTYALAVNEQHHADCTVEIIIQGKTDKNIQSYL